MSSPVRCKSPAVRLMALLYFSRNVGASLDPDFIYRYRQTFHFDLSASSLDDRKPLFISSVINYDDTMNGASWLRSDEEDDDGCDDNDDDGHSSMLSTITLQKKIVASNSNDSRLRNVYPKKQASRPNRRTSKALASKRMGNMNSSALWRMRGGAVSSNAPADWVRQILVSAMESPVGRSLLVSAVVTLVFEACLGHILEFLKIVMQTATSDSTTYLSVIRTITAEKGLAGLWDGFCPWGIVQAVCKGAVFGLAHASALQTLKPMAEKGYIPMALALTLAGGIGGGFQGYVLSPTLLLKTRVMTNPVFREKMSALRTTLLSFTIGYDVVKSEGLGALMKGANVFATKRVFDWASRYFFADLFEDLFVQLHRGSSLSVAEKSIASLLGGVFSTLVTLPLDVLVAKTQDAKKACVKVSPFKLFQDELKEKGWNGVRNAYMRGFEARLLHVCLTTVVIKTGTPIAYEAMFGTSK